MPGLAQYQAWPASVAREETDLLDTTQAWDETAGAEELFNYLFDTTSSLKYFEGKGVLELNTISLAKCGKMQSSAIAWTATTPAGTTITTRVSLSPDKGVNWGPWLPVSNGGSIPGLAAGLDVTNYRLKVKFEASTTDYDAGPSVSELVVTINSRKVLRLKSDGTLKAAKAMTENATETL